MAANGQPAAFVDTFSRRTGGVWTITVDSPATQLTHLAHAVGKADAVADLLPPTINGDGEEHVAPLHLDEQSTRDHFEKIAGDLSPSSLKDARDQDLAAWSNLYLSLAYAIYVGHEQYGPWLLKLVDTLAGLPSSAGYARYQSITTVFNSLPSDAPPALAGQTLAALLRLAASEASLPTIMETLRPALQSLPAQLATWQLPRSQTDAMVTDALAVAERDPNLSHTLLRSYLSGDAASNSESLRVALLALCLRLPHSYSFPTSSLSASLPEVGLARAVAAGQASAIPADVPERCGSRASLVVKARSLAIAKLLSLSVGQTVTYDKIRSALGAAAVEVGADADMDLEGWIIDAIKSGLISARLSQPKRQVAVLRVQLPGAATEDGASDFTAEWKTIGARLSSWQIALEKMVATVRNANGEGGEITADGQEVAMAQEIEA